MKSKIPDRWLPYNSVGDVVKGTRFIAFKVPLKESLCRSLPFQDRFTPSMLLTKIPRLALIVDLTNTNRYYNSHEEFANKSVSYEKIWCKGRELPTRDILLKFFQVVDEFMSENQDGDGLIGVHCTHGVNRTGYFICKYMIERLGMEPGAAIDVFNKARGHPMERENYLADLRGLPCEAVVENNHNHGSRWQRGGVQAKHRPGPHDRPHGGQHGGYQEGRQGGPYGAHHEASYGGPRGGYHPGAARGGYHREGPRGGHHPGGARGGYHYGGPREGHHPGGARGGYHYGGPRGGYHPGGARGGYHQDTSHGGYHRGGPHGGDEEGHHGGRPGKRPHRGHLDQPPEAKRQRQSQSVADAPTPADGSPQQRPRTGWKDRQRQQQQPPSQRPAPGRRRGGHQGGGYPSRRGYDDPLS